MTEEQINWANSGLTIQQAMLKVSETSAPKPFRSLLWNDRVVKVGEAIPVPDQGVVQTEFIHAKIGFSQGFDLKTDGYIKLRNGQRVTTLRTWCEPGLPNTVQYPFKSENGLLRFWNVYKRPNKQGKPVDEKWTENAGFWSQREDENNIVFHCSCGLLKVPDFESLVIRITVIPRADSYDD